MESYYDHAGITIYHGDCRDVLPGLGAIDLVLTDPPYGIGLEKHRGGGIGWHVEGDESQEVGEEVLCWCWERKLPQVAFASPSKPWPGQWRQRLVWSKGVAVGGGGDIKTCWKFDWELIQVRLVPRVFGKRESSVLAYPITPANFTYHPTQKPIELIKYLLSKTTKSGQRVLDPFMGSGTTMRAAKDMRRNAIGVEISEAYCEIAAKRLEQEALAFAE